jgi:kinesin family protein 18/19
MTDLAGSERAYATGCRGMRFTEGANINKSLLALGNCINSLANGLKHIPYCNSKLTRLLKDFLGSNCQTVMIANVSPSSTSYEDTYNTLKYATRAKKMKQTISMKKNIIFVQLNASQYAKVVESLTAENEKLKLKLKMYEAENGSQEGASTSAVAPAVPPNSRDKFSALYQELQAMYTEMSKLLKEIKFLNWRNCVKQKTAAQLTCLPINMIHLEERLNRIRTSVRKFEGREMTSKEKLRVTTIKWNEHYEKTNAVIKELDQDGTNTELKQYIAMLQLQLELEDKKMQLEHCQQLLFMQQNELESEDIIFKEMCNTLKQYRFLLQGYITTDAMISHYEELVHKLEGLKQISWILIQGLLIL